MFGLEAKVLWLFVFVALYWSYCIYWGVKGADNRKQLEVIYCWKVNVNLGFCSSSYGYIIFWMDFYGASGLIYRDGFLMLMLLFMLLPYPLQGSYFLKDNGC